MTEQKLLALAEQAAQAAYAPYSGFAVGAALLTKESKVYLGCNIENASFGATNCAERTAFFKAVSEGERAFSAIAIIGGKNGDFSSPCLPCGICRQVMTEFCDPDFKIILRDGEQQRVFTLDALLPHSFSMREHD